MTAYNARNKLAKSSNVGRSSRKDPESGGIIIVSQVDRSVCEMTGAGTRTLETAAGIGVGTKILCVSRTNAIDVVGATTARIDNGEYVEFVVTKDSSGVHQWVENGGTAETGLAARLTTAEADIDALEGVAYRTNTVKLSPYDFRVHDAMGTKLSAGPATSTDDDLGLTVGVIGTAVTPTLNATVDDIDTGNVQEAVILWQVPLNYVAAAALTLSVDFTRTAAADTTAVIDAEVYRHAAASTDVAGAPSGSGNINGAASGTITWAVTGTDVVPGEYLDIRLIVTIDDNAGASAPAVFEFEPEMIFTVADQS